MLFTNRQFWQAMDRFYGDSLYHTGAGKKFIHDFASVPVLGEYWKYKDYERYWNDYMSNRHTSWDSVKYPTLMAGAGTASNLGHRLFQPTERALKSLYAEKERDDWRKKQVSMHRERMEALDRRQRHYDAYLRAKYSGRYRY